MECDLNGSTFTGSSMTCALVKVHTTQSNGYDQATWEKDDAEIADFRKYIEDYKNLKRLMCTDEDVAPKKKEKQGKGTAKKGR